MRQAANKLNIASSVHSIKQPEALRPVVEIPSTPDPCRADRPHKLGHKFGIILDCLDAHLCNLTGQLERRVVMAFDSCSGHVTQRLQFIGGF
jgi:hypothetical protein